MQDVAPSSYWTLDWLTHPMKFSHVSNGALHQPHIEVNSAMCLYDMNKCLDDSTTGYGSVKPGCTSGRTSENYIKFSCAPTRNQTRYAMPDANSVAHTTHGFSEQNTCAKGDSEYDRAACQMQRMPEMSLVVNDDKTFSLSSGHSQTVLMFYVSVIMFTVNLFAVLSSDWCRKKYKDHLEDCNNVKWYKLTFGFVVFALLLLHRLLYTANSRWLGMDWPMPNGTFFYGLLAYVSVMWFAAKEDCGELGEDAKDGEGVEMVPNTPNALDIVARPDDQFDEPDVAGGPPYDNQLQITNGSKMKSKMNLNVTGFVGGNKIKTKAFMQPGASGNYKLENVTDLHLAQPLKAVDYQKADTPFTSLWALTQLWVLPLIVVSTFIVKQNFQLDINVTVVAVGMFVFGLLDLFGRRLLEIRYLYRHIVPKNQDTSVSIGVRVVYFVALVAQFFVLLVVFWTAGWSWNPSGYHPGVWIIGAPSQFKRAEIIGMFKTLLLIYYFATLLVKLGCLLPYDTNNKYNMQGRETEILGWKFGWKPFKYALYGKWFYRNLDGLNFTFLNVVLTIYLIGLISITWAGQQKGMQYYDAGVYLKQIAANL